MDDPNRIYFAHVNQITTSGTHHFPRTLHSPLQYLFRLCTSTLFAGINHVTSKNGTDPTLECAHYYNAEVNALVASYPPVWQIASIVQGDDEATQAYNAIVNDPNFPNLPPKGTPQGDFTGVNYTDADPDCWWSWSRCDTPKHANLPADTTTCPEPDTWGLSLDDGPNCTHNALYDYLQENDYTASLFFIGSNVIDWPFQAQRGLHDGHDIGVHTWSHRYSTALTNEQFFAELWYTRKIIKEIVGVTPTTWRAPFGDVDDRIRFIAHAMGLTTVLWDHDTFDWQIENAGNPNGLPTASVLQNYDSIYSAAAQGQFSTHGAIVLTHEINGATMDLVMSELPTIAKNFKHVVPVTTCQNISHPYVEQSFTFPTFAQWLNGNTKMSNSSSISNSTTSTSSASMTTSSSASMGSSTMTRQSTSSRIPSAINAANAAVTAKKTDTSGAVKRSAGTVTALTVLAVAFLIC